MASAKYQRLGNRLSPKKVALQLSASDRQARAVDLFVQGWTFRAIAKELDYAGPSGVKKAIDGAIKKAPSRAVEELRVEVEERSRVLLEQLMPIVVNKKTSREDRLQAIDRVIKIDRELRSLHGLDAPTHVKFDFSKFNDEQLRAFVSSAAGGAGEAGESGAAQEGVEGSSDERGEGTGEGQGGSTA